MRVHSVGVVLIALSAMAAQTPLPAPQPAPIPGIVIDDQNQPVLRARVANIASNAVMAITDQDGRFQLPRPSAATSARVFKNGYLGQIAQVQPNATGLTVRLVRTAVISGQVLDEGGDPIVRASVVAQRVDRGGGTFSRTVGDTDDRGEFRIAGLQAGEYVVETSIGGGARRLLYFPGAGRIEDAERIALQPGSERGGVNLIVPASPAFPPPGAATRGGIQPLATDTPGTSTIRGIVSDLSGRPLRRAEVIAAPIGARQEVRSTLSDTEGAFELTAMPGGRYRVAARRVGYVGGNFNGTLRATEDIDLAEGTTKDGIRLALVPWSTISGRVVDEFGDPMSGALVQVLRLGYEGGRRQLVPAGGSRRTDDTGSYRLFGLAPGSYIVRATIGDVSSADVPGYSATYYPGSTDAALARYVTLQPGEAFGGAEIALERARTFNVAGLIFGADGVPTMGGSVTLSASSRAGAVTAASVGARMPRDGVFEFANVTPGLYVIHVYRGRKNRWTEGEFGSATVNVNDADVKDVVVRMTKGSSITGAIVLDSADGIPPQRIQSIEILPVAVDLDQAPPNNWATAAIDRDGSFRLAGISGLRRLTVEGLPRGWGLADIRVNGIDITDAPLQFGTDRESLTNVEIRLTNLPSVLSGVVAASNAAPVARAPVILFSADRERWYPRSRFLRRVIANESGAFTIEGAPSGTYYVASPAALPALGNSAWQEPAYLESLTRDAQIVTISAGQRTTTNLRTR
jgi:protocatechuate 3,4-dioxygenase beta subunit